MNQYITKDTLLAESLSALNLAMDYISENRVFSVWTQKVVAWQELWKKSEFSGLYGTCAALALLCKYDRYEEIVKEACADLYYMFNTFLDYSESANDSKNERNRKARCRLLLEQNFNITLKAVYYLRTCKLLPEKYIDITSPEYCNMMKQAYMQVEKAFDATTGEFYPAKENKEDKSVLTTMQAYVVMSDYWGVESEKTIIAKKLMIGYLEKYSEFMRERDFLQAKSKFEKYRIKKGFIAGLYALSHAPYTLNESDIETLSKAVFDSIFDDDIRSGFFTISDSYAVPQTRLSRDTYRCDSKVIYLESIIQLMLARIIPTAFLEYYIDDIVEIIETVKQEKQYISWELTPSFSHNIYGLMVLHSLVKLLVDKKEESFNFLQIHPHLSGNKHYTISRKSVVMFLPSGKKYKDAFETVENVLRDLGFDLWCAFNDPYDTMIMDSIYGKLRNAQFVIIDCSEQKPNVMYEAGLSHGLGKMTMLCTTNRDDLPNGVNASDTCWYNSNGLENPPPYTDLQESLVKFIVNHIDEICLTKFEKAQLIKEILILSNNKHFKIGDSI